MLQSNSRIGRSDLENISRYQFIGEEHPRGNRLNIKASNYKEARRMSVTAPEQLSNDKFPRISFSSQKCVFSLQDFHIHALFHVLGKSYFSSIMQLYTVGVDG